MGVGCRVLEVGRGQSQCSVNKDQLLGWISDNQEAESVGRLNQYVTPRFKSVTVFSLKIYFSVPVPASNLRLNTVTACFSLRLPLFVLFFAPFAAKNTNDIKPWRFGNLND